MISVIHTNTVGVKSLFSEYVYRKETPTENNVPYFQILKLEKQSSQQF